MKTLFDLEDLRAVLVFVIVSLAVITGGGVLGLAWRVFAMTAGLGG